MTLLNLMHLIRLLALLMIAALMDTASVAQEAPPTTGKRFNCREWRNFPSGQRLGYVMGFWEGSSFTLSISAPQKESYAKQVLPFSGASSYEEIRMGLDSFCSAPENASIPVYAALLIFTAKVKGVAPAGIESIAAEFRKKAADTATGGKP